MATAALYAVPGDAEMGIESGFPAEFRALVEEHRQKLLRQALAILRNHSDAEDVVQETFCEAFKDRDKLAQVQSLGAWLSVTNHRNALNRLRTRQREQHRLVRKQRELPTRALTTGGFSGIELRDSIAKAIEPLPPSVRAAVVLRYFEHLSYAQIAERLKISKRTVGTLLCQASAHLYKALQLDQKEPLPAAGDKEPTEPVEGE